jgi:hypothetical protein
MAIVLGGVTLSKHMIWVDEFDYSDVAQSNNRTLGGRQIIFSQTLVGGRPITLEAQIDQGWLTRAQVDDVKALSAVSGAAYALTIGAQNFTVMFRHEEPPAFAAKPLVFRVDAPDTDYFTAVIKLFTI